MLNVIFVFLFVFFAKFHLKIKNYYIRILIGVKNGISTPTFPPKTLNLVGPILNRFFNLDR